MSKKDLMNILSLLMVAYIGFQEKYSYAHYHGQSWFKIMIILVPLIFMTVMAALIRKSKMGKKGQTLAMIALGICVAALLIMNITEFLC